MRLDKFFSVTGTLTRSEALRAVRAKRVTVNGTAAKKADTPVNPETDRIELDGKQIVYRRFTYIMLNKPQGYVSATEDGKLPTVIELLPTELRRLGLFPCGRLDRDTTGLMLLTDDGSLAHFLLSPVGHVAKTYAFSSGLPLDAETIAKLESGVDIGEDEPTKPAKVTSDGCRGEIIITEGKYHQIKRMFTAVGNSITSLERVTFGGLKLDSSLGRGEWRYLTDEETADLRKHDRSNKEN